MKGEFGTERTAALRVESEKDGEDDGEDNRSESICVCASINPINRFLPTNNIRRCYSSANAELIFFLNSSSLKLRNSQY